MVSILPSARTPWDVLGQQTGQALQQVLPGAIEKGFERERGINALDRAQAEIAQAGGDPYKIALAFARAGAQNPALERSLGPLAQTAMMNAKVGNAFGQKGTPTGQPSVPGADIAMGAQPIPQPGGTTPAQPSTYATPGAFNIMTPAEINAESERYAQAVLDPNAYQTRQTQLQNQNVIATEQRAALEDMALKSGISPGELPRFMMVGSKFDPRNPSEWAQNAKREYAKVKANDDKLQKAFIPGLGSGLLGRDRDATLKKLQNTVQDQVKAGLEQETRNFLADNYLTPTEVEELIHPLTPSKEKAIKALPKGLFPRETFGGALEEAFTGKFEKPTVSYEEAVERAPKELQRMQNQLADFFLKNVDDDTSLLVLRDKLWNEKDYDWRQIGPAIREAESKGLKLSPSQSTEMTDIETQAPYQSLPDIFQDFDRVIKYFRGSK